MVDFTLIFRSFEIFGLHKYYRGNNGRGFVLSNGVKYIILVDSDCTQEQQAFTLRHELAHIILNHFDFDSDEGHQYDESKEKEADLYASQMSDEEFSTLMKHCISTLHDNRTLDEIMASQILCKS